MKSKVNPKSISTVKHYTERQLYLHRKKDNKRAIKKLLSKIPKNAKKGYRFASISLLESSSYFKLLRRYFESRGYTVSFQYSRDYLNTVYTRITVSWE